MLVISALLTAGRSHLYHRPPPSRGSFQKPGDLGHVWCKTGRHKHCPRPVEATQNEFFNLRDNTKAVNEQNIVKLRAVEEMARHRTRQYVLYKRACNDART